MKLRLSTVLNAPLEQVFEWVKTPRLLQYIAHPLIEFRPIEPATFPEVWSVGDYHVEMRFLGLIPVGEQSIRIRLEPSQQIPGQRYRILDDGHSHLIQRWHHLIHLEALPNGHTKYVDELEVEAGLLTKPIWLSAYLFYTHRQYRWQLLIQDGFKALA
jgi:hypothetical protein